MKQSRNRREAVTSRLRLRGRDYSDPGTYFVTICVADRACRFGRVAEDMIIPNDAGEMIIRRWLEIPDRFPDVRLDAFCLMPNHFHGLMIAGRDADQPAHGNGPSLIQVVQWFKSISTVDYIREIKERGWEPFSRHLWQVGYHDHIVRGERDLARIRTYFENNPSNWRQDTFWEESGPVSDKDGLR